MNSLSICAVALSQVLNAFTVKAEEPPHPADKLRWSIAVTNDPENAGSSESEDGGIPRKVTWVHPPSPDIAKRPTPAKSILRTHPASSASTNSRSTTTRPKKVRTKSQVKPSSVSLAPLPSLPPLPPFPPRPLGPIPRPNGPPAIPVSTTGTKKSPRSVTVAVAAPAIVPPRR